MIAAAAVAGRGRGGSAGRGAGGGAGSRSGGGAAAVVVNVIIVDVVVVDVVIDVIVYIIVTSAVPVVIPKPGRNSGGSDRQWYEIRLNDTRIRVGLRTAS